MNRLLIASFLFIFSISLFSQSYEDLVSKSMDYLDAKEYQAAEETLKAALRKEPANKGNILLFSNLGTIQRHLGKKEDALLSYNLALMSYPNAVFLLKNRAALYCEMDSLNSAMRDYNIILSIEDSNVEALYNRGLLYMSEKNILAAESDFERILEIQPNNILAKSGLAFLLKSRGDWDAAETIYTDLIYENRSLSDLYVNRAECYLRVRKLARAKEDLQKALDLGYDDPLLYILRGQLNLEHFDKFAAKQDFEKALELGANETVIKDYISLCK